MAVKKATTTEDLTASAKSVTPTLEDRVEQVTELTDSAVVAKVEDVDYVKVKSPTGTVTTVPASIAGALLESGYSKSK